MGVVKKLVFSKAILTDSRNETSHAGPLFVPLFFSKLFFPGNGTLSRLTIFARGR